MDSIQPLTENDIRDVPFGHVERNVHSALLLASLQGILTPQGSDMVSGFRDYLAQLTPFPTTHLYRSQTPPSDIHSPTISENATLTAKPRELSPAEVVYMYCEYNL